LVKGSKHSRVNALNDAKFSLAILTKDKIEIN